jgi:hypothetical protein
MAGERWGGELLLKIKVVVSGKEIVYSSHNRLEVINKADGTLVVTEPFADKTNVVAVFKVWDYWEPIPSSDPADR